MSKVCWDDRDVTEEKMNVGEGSEKIFASNTLPGS